MEPPGTFSLETCDFQYDKRAGRSTHHYAQALLWPEASSRQLDDASCAGTKKLVCACIDGSRSCRIGACPDCAAPLNPRVRVRKKEVSFVQTHDYGFAAHSSATTRYY